MHVGTGALWPGSSVSAIADGGLGAGRGGRPGGDCGARLAVARRQAQLIKRANRLAAKSKTRVPCPLGGCELPALLTCASEKGV